MTSFVRFVDRGVVLNVEVAHSLVRKARGLAFRSSLGDTGMLFPMKKTRAQIWMWGMRMSLDIVWIAEGKVVHIDAQVAPPRRWTLHLIMPLFLKRYSAGQAVDFVLETRAGFCASHAIVAGDAVVCEAL